MKLAQLKTLFYKALSKMRGNPQYTDDVVEAMELIFELLHDPQRFSKILVPRLKVVEGLPPLPIEEYLLKLMCHCDEIVCRHNGCDDCPTKLQEMDHGEEVQLLARWIANVTGIDWEDVELKPYNATMRHRDLKWRIQDYKRSIEQYQEWLQEAEEEFEQIKDQAIVCGSCERFQHITAELHDGIPHIVGSQCEKYPDRETAEGTVSCVEYKRHPSRDRDLTLADMKVEMTWTETKNE